MKEPHTHPTFTDPELAIEECVTLTRTTGVPHSIVQADDVLLVVPRDRLDFDFEVLETVNQP